MSKELVLISEVKEGVIKHNFDEILEDVRTRVEPYKGRVVTQDTEKEAKADIAYLRKTVTEVENRRKDVKRDFMKPYNEFESKVKLVVAEINAPILEMDSQIKDLDRQRVEEKMHSVQELKQKLITDASKKNGLKDYILDCSFFDNPRWENSTFTMKKIEEEIGKKIAQIESDVAAINKFGGVYVSLLHGDYRKHGDITRSLLKKDELEASSRISQEVSEAKPEPVVESAPVEPPQELEKRTYEYQIRTTAEGFRRLHNYCRENGVAIRRI